MMNRCILIQFCQSLVLVLVLCGPLKAMGSDSSWLLQAAKTWPHADKAMLLGATRAGERIVAVGEHGIVLLSDDQGASYRQARSVPAAVTLTAVQFVTAQVGWAVGQLGVVLRTQDGGETWTQMRSDASQDLPLFSLWFDSTKHGYVAGRFGTFLETNDAGLTWAEHDIVPEGSFQRHVFDLFGGPDGTFYGAAEMGGVYRFARDGSWEIIDTGYEGSFWAGTALTDGTLLVVGMRGSLYRSDDGGANWVRVDTGTTDSLTDVIQLPDGTVIAVGMSGISLVSHDNGHSFEKRSRADRLPLTAVSFNVQGQPQLFSQFGVVSDDSSQ